MNEESKEVIFSWYCALESQVAKYLCHVPPHGPNLQAWSPTMASVILSGCGLLDSIFRDLSASLLAKYGISKNAEDLTITDYYRIFEPEWKLSETKGIFLVSPPEMLNPYGAWASPTYVPLSWWQVHNDLKHDLLSNITNATFQSARDTLCAVLLAISSCKALRPHLLRQKWINTGDWGIPYLLENMGANAKVTLETDLFAVPIGFRSQFSDIKRFNPNEWEPSSRVSAFFR